KLLGKGTAQGVALGMEYHWQPDVPYARASFPDRHYFKVVGRGFDIPDGAVWKVLEVEADPHHWLKSWHVELNATGSDLLKIVDTKLAEGWTKLQSSSSNGIRKTLWKFTDEEKQTWQAVSSVEELPEGMGKFTLTLRIDRLGQQ